MSLRYRLFISVGALFFVAFGLSFFLENYLTHKNLLKAEAQFRQDILNLNEKKRQDIENFLVSGLLGREAIIDATLRHTASYQKIWQSFGPEVRDTRNSAAMFLLFFKGINFIQNTINGHLASLIIPNLATQEEVHLMPVDEDFGWVIWESSEQEPCIGIRTKLPHVSPYFTSGSEMYLLFSFEELLAAPNAETIFDTPGSTRAALFAILTPEERSAAIGIVFEEIRKAQNYLRKGAKQTGSNNILPWAQQEISRIQKTIPKEASVEHCFSPGSKMLNQRFAEDLQDIEMLGMIWRLSNFLAQEGPKTAAFFPPFGIARFDHGLLRGTGITTEETFYTEPLFDDEGYYSTHPAPPKCAEIATEIALIAPPDCPHLFLGNTLKIPSPTTVGYLTLGFDINDLLQELSLVIHEIGFVVHNGRIISAFSEEGKLIPPQGIPIGEILEKDYGVVPWEGESYFFLHIVPFKNLDLHFFVMEPEEKAFALIKDLDQGTQQVLEDIAFTMRFIALGGMLIALLFLYRLSKKIVLPISLLATATESIEKGRLEDVHLPPLSSNRRDEVMSLYASFDRMIKGLQEREKVKSVLSKVVSQEIATEILKGTVHLGGEEKEVTVLFADIRHFTHITQKMAPHEVIDILNTCMTKISHEIDKQEGVIDKYIGDSVMALFGAPLSKKDSAFRAILSAIKMVEELKKWNKERVAAGLVPIEMGIGIHTGLVLAGNMGAEDRLNYTVLGSNVNLASRLCDAALAMQIVISKSTYEAHSVKENIVVKEIAPMKLQGFDEPVPVFEVVGLKNG